MSCVFIEQCGSIIICTLCFGVQYLVYTHLSCISKYVSFTLFLTKVPL